MKQSISKFASVAAKTASASSPKPFDQIPGPRRSLFLGENPSRELPLTEYVKYLQRLYNDYGPIVREDFGFGRGSVVHIFDPRDSSVVFGCEGKWPHIVPLQETTQKYREMRGMSPGLGNMNGPEWYRIRNAVQPIMNPIGAERYLPSVETVAEQLIEAIRSGLDENEEIDMNVVAGRWSLESSGRLVFEKVLGGLKENAKWADYLINLNKEIFKLSSRFKFGFPWYHYFSTRNWKRMTELEDKFYREVEILIDETVEELKIDPSSKKLAGELMQRQNMTLKDLKTVMLSLFTDGLSTTAPTLVYNLYTIAVNQAAQERIRKEVNSVSPKGEDLTSARRSKMPYHRACIKETFRLFPIGSEISRVPQEDLVLSGYVVPAGTPVDINTNVFLRSEMFFKNAESFVPERWLRENKREYPVCAFSYLPFGFGPRMCAGRRFAEQDLQVVMARLIQNFNISYKHGEIRQKYETLLLPEGDGRFHFQPL